MRAAFTLLACLSVAGAARADEPLEHRYLVIPTLSGETGEAEHVAEELIPFIPDLGEPLLMVEEARTSFEARESRVPQSLQPDDLDVVVSEAQRASMSIAIRRRADAREAIGNVLTRANRALESLNRETRSAESVLHACLADVRNQLETVGQDAARAAARECRRLVPQLEPQRFEYTPRVLELLDAVDAELAAGPHGSLVVEAERNGCAVFVNGRHLGTTPHTLPHVPPGEYRVQVECAGARDARVHRVIVAAQTATVHVDTVFDAALQTHLGIVLRYPSTRTEARHRVHHGAHIGRVVQASDVLLVTPENETDVRIDHLDVASERVVASARLRVTGNRRADMEVYRAALEGVVEGTSFDFVTGEPMHAWGHASAVTSPVIVASHATREPIADAVDDSVDAPSRPVGTGIVVGSIGVAAYATSWLLFAQMLSANDLFAVAEPGDADYIPRQERTSESRLPVVLTGAAGGVLATAAVPMLLPSEEGLPWWAVALGGIGAGGAVAGTVLLFTDGACIDDACTRRFQNETLGAQVLFHAAPLLAVPLTYVLRSDASSASIDVGSDHAVFTLRGHL